LAPCWTGSTRSVPSDAKRCIDLMVICGRIMLKSGWRLCSTRQRGVALDVVDVLIVRYLLEELADA
jgi:hypothetical protein